ncbi:MAG: isoprenylcysteine carboxylmethyltransferase family protein [Anaerolineae bacterium]
MSERGRGETWVAVQAVLLGGIFFAPRLINEDWGALSGTVTTIGYGISTLGVLIFLAAAFFLGRNLTVFPKPKDDGHFVGSGVYALVRHPMYSSVFLIGVGFALANNSSVALALAVILGIFFDRKAAQEEIWLTQKYAEYAEYKKRVKKLIPFIY